ncbi:uncharacterized protein N7515_008820 [Penicillium bovifimosum]|uniref:Uncharacterized protein n=1 Tax=Penicillium bovifimosum TaxID=126998 RepID=A0A9W9GQ80_9EURO|nr:uncharacterized protein N7515_008820 [Penicillium bovifimosum]KAJ5124995.1 hypothetical protein N7515_008820 [Penicillium bovifimosum]
MQQEEAPASYQDYQSGTPPRPPYSPVTPVFAQLVPLPSDEPRIAPPPASPSPRSHFPPSYPDYSQHTPPANPPVFIPQPPPVAISDSENPDAIALRSAITILQMQKQQSLRDIQALNRLKDSAAADPERFAHQLAAGALKTENHGAVIQFSDVATDDKDEDEEADPKPTNPDRSPSSDFGHIPNPQNVVRMPPINWGKYQVVGESLDRMHEEQLHRPSSGEPGQRAPEYLLASPYRPLVDQLVTPKSGRPSKAKQT